MKDIKVSLITTLYNESKNIEAFLDSYKKQTVYADEFIIVDGGSTDGTINFINNFIEKNKDLNIRLIVDESCSKKFVKGPIARGRNVAIKNAKYHYIAVTDAGCVLDSKWFEEIIKPFQDKKVDVVSGWYKALVTNDFQKTFEKIAMPNLETLDKNSFLPSSRSIAFKKECWERVGGYPEATLTAEDTKFDLDLKKAGCRFVFTEKAFVYWECPKNRKEAYDKMIYYAKGDGKLKLFFIKFLVRNIFLIFPIRILLDKEKRKNFTFHYGQMFYYQLGYIKGIFS